MSEENSTYNKTLEEIGWDLYELTGYIGHVTNIMNGYCYRDQRKDYVIPTTPTEIAEIGGVLSKLVERIEKTQSRIEILNTNNK